MGDASEETKIGRDRKENILHGRLRTRVKPSGRRGLETARGRGRSSLSACEGVDRRGTA
jgi:hypothetical protein